MQLVPNSVVYVGMVMLISFYNEGCSKKFGICWYGGAGVRRMLISFYSAGCSKQFDILLVWCLELG